MARRTMLTVLAAGLVAAGLAPAAAAPFEGTPTVIVASDPGDIDPFPLGACVSSSRLEHPICVFVDPDQD